LIVIKAPVHSLLLSYIMMSETRKYTIKNFLQNKIKMEIDFNKKTIQSIKSTCKYKLSKIFISLINK